MPREPLSVRLSPTALAAVEKLAADVGVSRGEYARALIVEALGSSAVLAAVQRRVKGL